MGEGMGWLNLSSISMFEITFKSIFVSRNMGGRVGGEMGGRVHTCE